MRSSIKLPFSLILAVIINLFLFLAIQKLVQPEHSAKSLPEMVTMVDFVRLKKDDKVAEPKRNELPDKPEPPKKPPPPKQQQPEPEKPKPQKVKLPTPEVKLPLQMTKGPHLGEFLKKPKPRPKVKQKVAPIPEPVIEAEPIVEEVVEPVAETPVKEASPAPEPAPAKATIETDVQPTYRKEPKYPSRASRAGISGVVTVEFTITAEGRVTDPVIISSNPPRIFNKAVLKAIKYWKFKPRVVNGKPVSRRARQNIKFNMK